MVGYAVEGESPVSDTVSVTSDGCAEASGVAQVLSEGVIAESDITKIAVFVEDVEFNDSAAIFADGSGLALLVSEGVVEDFAAFRSNAEETFSDGHGVCGFSFVLWDGMM